MHFLIGLAAIIYIWRSWLGPLVADRRQARAIRAVYAGRAEFVGNHGAIRYLPRKRGPNYDYFKSQGLI